MNVDTGTYNALVLPWTKHMALKQSEDLSALSVMLEEDASDVIEWIHLRALVLYICWSTQQTSAFVNKLSLVYAVGV